MRHDDPSRSEGQAGQHPSAERHEGDAQRRRQQQRAFHDALDTDERYWVLQQYGDLQRRHQGLSMLATLRR
jgi:hypothetical protein